MRRRTRSPPRNAQLSRPRTPWSRLRAVVDYRPKLARTLADRGRRPAIRGFPLNQSTGHSISSANARLPRFTGSRSFHSRNFAAPHRAVQTGTGIQAGRGYVRFCAWRCRRARRWDDCGRRWAPAHPTAFSIRNAIFRAAGAAVQPSGMAGYRSHLPEVDGRRAVVTPRQTRPRHRQTPSPPCNPNPAAVGQEAASVSEKPGHRRPNRRRRRVRSAALWSCTACRRTRRRMHEGR